MGADKTKKDPAMKATKGPVSLSKTARWNAHLEECKEYKKKHGDCLVPRRYEENPSLGNFVNKQRQSYRKFLMGEKSSINDVSSSSCLCKLCTSSFIHLICMANLSCMNGIITSKRTV